MAHPVVSCECVCTAKRLLLIAEIAPYLLFACVVDRVLVPREIVGPRENSVTRLASTRVDAVAFVRTSLAAEETRRHAHILYSRGCRMGLSVSFPLVLLKLCWRLEA